MNDIFYEMDINIHNSVHSFLNECKDTEHFWSKFYREVIDAFIRNIEILEFHSRKEPLSQSENTIFNYMFSINSVNRYCRSGMKDGGNVKIPKGGDQIVYALYNNLDVLREYFCRSYSKDPNVYDNMREILLELKSNI